MLGRKDMKREDAYATRLTVGKENETARAFAARMLSPQGKNPYYKGSTAIRNLDELDRNMTSFDAGEAGWVADWLEYLGDPITASRIRRTPSDFKRIIHERHEELRRLA